MIYISGHGGEADNRQLELSGKGAWAGKIIEWTTILDIIRAAECDVLVILDCCNAGLAGARGLEDKHTHNLHSKKLIAASDWGSTTEDRLAAALCEALPTWCHGQPTDRQAKSLYQTLLRIMKDKRDAALRESDLAMQECSDSIKREEASLKRLNKKLSALEDKMNNETEKHDGAKRKGQARDKQWEKLDRETEQVEDIISETEHKIKELRSTKKKLEKDQKGVRKSHPQPFHTNLNPIAGPWTLKGGYYNAGTGRD
ncbi:hypothetical protein V8F06_011617 [Rhypophila decipiens]